MSANAREARDHIIGTYNRKTDKVGLFQNDWEQSNLTEHGDHKFTKRNAGDLLSNTIGASTAQQHKDTRSAKLVMETTHFLTIEKPELSNGWNFTCTPDPKLTSSKHTSLGEKALHNSKKKTVLLEGYSNPERTHHKMTEARRNEKRRARNEAGIPKPLPIKTKAKPRTLLADLTCVQDLEYFEPPPETFSPESSQRAASGRTSSGVSRSPTPPVRQDHGPLGSLGETAPPEGTESLVEASDD